MQREKEIKTTAHIDLGLVSDGLTGKRKSVPFPWTKIRVYFDRVPETRLNYTQRDSKKLV